MHLVFLKSEPASDTLCYHYCTPCPMLNADTNIPIGISEHDFYHSGCDASIHWWLPKQTVRVSLQGSLNTFTC